MCKVASQITREKKEYSINCVNLVTIWNEIKLIPISHYTLG